MATNKGKERTENAGRKKQVQTSTPAKDLQYITVPTDSIVVGSFNPRHTFDVARMQELTDSVRAKGVLEPLLVRLLAKPKGKAKYELIAGERRWRAAQRAKRASVPVGVGDFSDQEALEIAVIENEQRTDVAALEKAEGYQRLMQQYGYSAKTLAERIHKSEAEIHATVKLLRVPELVKPYLNDGTLSKSHGEIIARIPNEEGRVKLARQILYSGGGNTVNVASVREAKRYADSYTRELSKATFDTTVENLVEGVCACTVCPFKSGNNRIEFGDGRADICNNVPCFIQKTEAGRARMLAALSEKKGAIPLPQDDIKKYLPYGYLSGNTPYVELSSQCYQDKKYRSHRQLVGKELGKSVKLFVAVKERDSSIVELALRSEVNEVLKRVHNIDLNGRAGSGKENTERRLKSQARGLAAVKALSMVAAYFQKNVMGSFAVKLDKHLRMAAISMLNAMQNDALRDVAKRRGLEIKGKYPQFAKELAKAAAKMNGAELFGLMMEAGVSESLFFWRGPYGGDIRESSKEVLKTAGVNLSALEAAELKTIREKRTERERKSKANKAKKATKGKNAGGKRAETAKV
jgi:ParB/RepB/Spo0J family partition protein